MLARGCSRAVFDVVLYKIRALHVKNKLLLLGPNIAFFEYIQLTNCEVYKSKCSCIS